MQSERGVGSFWAGKKILVTGGTGFLGHHVVERLKATEAAAVISLGSKDGDLTQENEVRRLFEAQRPDIVFHIAGLVGGILANKSRPADFFRVNLLMNTYVLHYAHVYGVKKIISAAAGCGYPEDAPLPLSEEFFWRGFPQKESAPYSLAKRMLHIQSLAYHRQFGFCSIVCIPGNLYGPYDNFSLEDSHVVPALVRKFYQAVQNNDASVEVWGSGRPTRDFVYAGDVAEGMLRAAEIYKEPQLVNMSSGRETSTKELAQLIAELTEFRGRIVWNAAYPDGQSRRLLSMDKCRKDLNFEPPASLKEGLRLTIQWFQENYKKGIVRLQAQQPLTAGGK